MTGTRYFVYEIDESAVMYIWEYMIGYFQQWIYDVMMACMQFFTMSISFTVNGGGGGGVLLL